MAEKRLRVGTMDTFLIWKLTDGKTFATDSTNASRTMLFNVKTNDWDSDLLKIFGIPREILPSIVPSSGIVGYTTLLGKKVPIAGIAGDQQASLFGQACFSQGMAKNTYGTGCFILVNIGDKFQLSEDNLITTVAWNIGGKLTYAYEGSVFNAGSSVQWLRDELFMIEKASDTERYALKVPDTNGVYVVPAFTGLGAPHWDMNARGTVCGLTRGANKYHFVRAVLESMAYSSYDVLHAMEKDVGKIKVLKVDGGASNNNFLMQFQSDIMDTVIARPVITETTGLGVAYLAGLATGAYKSLDDISANWVKEKEFVPTMDKNLAKSKLAGWEKAVEKSKSWEA
ncbi:MAG: glycerol kinase GlpK [Clostridia bacterium]|nr:glycerol kinase GlpK [Clostridia bacterium]